MPFEVYLACAGGDGIDVAAYEALHTTLDFAALYDLIEMQVVSGTWAEAQRANAKLRHEAEAAARPPRPRKALKRYYGKRR